ncbi:hypothetical protein Ahy_A09g042924 isoform D [Arachis hypogaea]|uniref:Uncharacterized protein n=1 Tax=Arachis hypogaea TaxID=3818 RepID=A0A445BH31_ARAHY|nr:hypothetical protein Ahy_A09g042924 isoform D [Arachis hypogaea]
MGGRQPENQQKTVEPDGNRPVRPNQNPAGLQNGKLLRFFLPFSLSFFQSEKSHKSNHKTYTTATRRGILPPSVALKVRHPSLASLVLQVSNPCSLSPIAVASSSSASVVFVCSAALPSPFVCCSRSRLRSRSSPFAFTRCSPFEFAFVWKPRCSASNSATKPRAPLSCRTALCCPRREFPKPATRQYTHTTDNTNTLLQTLQLLISTTINIVININI